MTNVLGYDYEDICNNVPHDFKIIPKQPFDDVNEELVLKNDEEEIRIHCPLYLQLISEKAHGFNRGMNPLFLFSIVDVYALISYSFVL